MTQNQPTRPVAVLAILFGIVAAMIVVGVVAVTRTHGRPSTTHPTNTPTPSTAAARGWQELTAGQVTISVGEVIYEPTPGAVMIGGHTYSDATSATLTVTGGTAGAATDGSGSIDVEFALSQRYTELKVVFGIPDNAVCCSTTTVSYSIDAGPRSAPVTVKLGRPDPIDLPVTGASSLQVHLVLSGGSTAAFGGAQGLLANGHGQSGGDTPSEND